MIFRALVAITLGWGALTFGAVHGWAYTPLGVLCVTTALASLVSRRHVPSGRISGAVVAALVCVGIAAALPLIPLPQHLLARVSPGTDHFLRIADLEYTQLATGASALVRPVTIDPSATKLGLALFAVLAIFLVGLTRGLTARDARHLPPIVIVIGAALSVLALLQGPGYNGTKPTPGFILMRPETSVFGPFINRNHLAGWMLMALPLGLGYLFALMGARSGVRTFAPRQARGDDPRRAHYRRMKWLSSRDGARVMLTAFGLLVMAIALVMTLSRSGLVCFALALGMLMWVRIAHDQHHASRFESGYLLLVLSLAIAGVGFNTLIARVETTSIDLVGRIGIWSDALHVWRDFPVFGSGLDTFGTAMRQYQTAIPGMRVLEAHNDYLQILAEGGLLLALPVLASVVILVQTIRKRVRRADDSATSLRRDDSRTWWIRIGAVTGLVAIALQEFVEFSLQMPGNAALFCVLLALALGDLPHRTHA